MIIVISEMTLLVRVVLVRFKTLRSIKSRHLEVIKEPIRSLLLSFDDEIYEDSKYITYNPFWMKSKNVVENMFDSLFNKAIENEASHHRASPITPRNSNHQLQFILMVRHYWFSHCFANKEAYDDKKFLAMIQDMYDWEMYKKVNKDELEM